MNVPTFVITMPQRFARITQHLDTQNLDYRIFPAFDGAKMGLSTKNPYLRDHDAAYWAENPAFYCGSGIQALATTNYALIKLAIAMNFDNLLILEDDVELAPNWQQQFEQAREAMPKDWLVYWGSHCCTTTIRPYKPEISLARGYPLCTPFMFYNKPAFQIIEDNAKLASPWDVYLYDTFCMARPDQCFIAHPNQLASQLSISGALPTTLS